MSLKDFLKPDLKKILIFIALLILILGGLYLILGVYPYWYVYQSNSMSPAINNGDMVFVKSANFDDIENNDVLAFITTSSKMPIIHRVISIDASTMLIGTKGDANQYQLDIEKEIQSSQILGKVVFVVPLLGYLDLIYIGWLIRIIVLYLLACLLSSLIVTSKDRKY